jgi:hypothetical protein
MSQIAVKGREPVRWLVEVGREAISIKGLVKRLIETTVDELLVYLVIFLCHLALMLWRWFF